MANSSLGPGNLIGQPLNNLMQTVLSAINSVGDGGQQNNSTQTVLSGIEIFNICIYFVVFALGIVGNGLVIYVTGYKMKTTVNSIWFLNLAIADFIFILIIILYIVTAFNKIWLFGDFMCKFVSFVTVLNMFASIFLLTAISLDRCLSTWVIVWAQNKRTLFKARIICTFMWFLSIGCSIPFVRCRSGQNNTCSYVCTTDIMKSLFIYRFMVGFLIPFLIIASSYIAIGVRAKRLKRGKKLKPFRVIISVILAFFICWFPFHVQQLFSITAQENQWSDMYKVFNNIGPFVNCLVHLNSCLNPILYVFMCEEFKKKLKQSLLLVLETAFAEEHLSFRSSRPSTCSRLSESQSLKQTNETTMSSCGSNQDINTCC
ncbi:C3a anaphylatoxin chemotactic receptor-like isoform X1 [Labeo rohita]|uniref:C3a anaphylatoxin chemotactic receptor-like isoform X1 n=1 Tax=Labeo rohita TaxID=84645 RepID=UPI0021E24F38|nr:C3a anaphylatoxin chemotactic receptor-like isoform X1 [Labeo rohita]XP_050985831.1 C3a anaphylatoxin chemotactic receptor-like isoform X1 [Labeo rohita]